MPAMEAGTSQDGPPPDRFVGAAIATRAATFDAGQYSFFGDLGGGSGLGGLEDGLEGGLDDDGDLQGDDIRALEDDDVALLPDEDFSLATMLRNQTQAREEIDMEEDTSFAELLSKSLPKDMLKDDDPGPVLSTPPRMSFGTLGQTSSQQQQQQQGPSCFSPLFPSMQIQHGFQPSTPQHGYSPSPLAGMFGQLGISSSPAAQQHHTPIQQQHQQPSPLLHLLQQRPPQQPVTISGPMAAEQLEAQMLSKAAAASPQPLQGTPTGPLHDMSGHRPPFPGPHAQPPFMQPMMGSPGPGMPPFPPQGPPHMLSPGMHHHMGGMPPRGPPMHGPPMHGTPLSGNFFMQRGGPGPGPRFMHPGMSPQQQPMASPMMQPHMHQGRFGPPQPMAYNQAARGRFNNHDEAGNHQSPMHHRHSPMRRRLAATLMSGDEIEHIMNIMYAAVHNGLPYVEDYYYQAFVNKHLAGRNSAHFFPESLHDLTEEVARLDPSSKVRFAAAEGLGKIVLSNIRTPKVLMDLSSGPDKDAKGAKDGEGKAARPLEQEPLLAARIMVEDCMSLLLDVDDIDRCFAAAAARGGPVNDAEQMKQRRVLLVACIASSFRLPTTPTAAAGSTDAQAPVGDGVFMRVISLPKGRTLLARTLKLLLNGPQVVAQPADGPATIPDGSNGIPLHLLWALLRNCQVVFGSSLSGLDPSAERAMLESTAKLAAAARDVMLKLAQPNQVVDALAAYLSGTKQHLAAVPPGSSPMDATMLPLANTRTGFASTSGSGGGAPSAPEWLGEVLAALLERAEQLGVGKEGTEAQLAAGWRAHVDDMMALLAQHLETVQMVHAAASATTPPNMEALGLVRSLTCKQLIHAMFSLVGDQQRDQLRDIMLRLLA